MPPVAYVYLRGLPFSERSLTPAHHAPGENPQAVLERGRVCDLNLPAAVAGVLLGSTVRQAKQVCPELATVSFDAAVYEAAMRPFRAALWEETDHFEADGPSAVFVDLAGGGAPVPVVNRLRAQHSCFSMVAAIAGSKFMARAAVLVALGTGTYYDRPMFGPLPAIKACRCAASTVPSGTGAVPGEAFDQGVSPGPFSTPALELVDLVTDGSRREKALLAVLPVGFIWPVAEEIRERLYRLGIKTCGDLARISRLELSRLFGAQGHYLADLALGIDREPVRVSYSRDEIIRRVDFDAPIASRLTLKRSLGILSQDLGECLAAEGLACRVLNLVIRFDEGEAFTRQRVFSHPQGDPQFLGSAVTAMLDRAEFTVPVLGVEVSAAGLDHAVGRQLSFLSRAAGQDQQLGAIRAVSDLERRFPGQVVRLGLPPASRRERMLALVDPVRWRERAVSAD